MKSGIENSHYKKTVEKFSVVFFMSQSVYKMFRHKNSKSKL